MAPPSVALVHGLASSFERNWRAPGWVDLLADAGRRVVPVDLLGHGAAAKPHDPQAYADLEGDLARQLPEEPVDAVGFSLGARVLLGLAVREPGRFVRLVLGGVGESMFRNDDPGALADAIEGKTEAQSPIAQAFARFARSHGNDAAAVAACLRRPAPRLRPADLAAVNVPVLVVIGDRDFNGPGEPLVDALPDARLVTLRNVDHLGTPEDFGFIDAALEFLEAVPELR